MDEPGAPVAAESDVQQEGRMPLIEHLKALRVRLIRALLALGAGFLIAYAFAERIFSFLTWPIRSISHQHVMLIGTGVGEAFFVKLKVALIAALFVASPAILYETWKFIAPGLLASERRMA